jgi:hypothetical protein
MVLKLKEKKLKQKNVMVKSISLLLTGLLIMLFGVFGTVTVARAAGKTYYAQYNGSNSVEVNYTKGSETKKISKGEILKKGDKITAKNKAMYLYIDSGTAQVVNTNASFTLDKDYAYQSAYEQADGFSAVNLETPKISSISIQDMSVAANSYKTISYSIKGNITDENLKVKISVSSGEGALALYYDYECTRPVSPNDEIPKGTYIYAKGLKIGTATVSVTSVFDTTKSDNCTITVTPEEYGLRIGSNENVVTSVNKSGDGWSFDPSTTLRKATIKLEDSKKKQTSDSHAAELRFKTTNPKIAKVDKNGKITGVAAGSCTVYAYARNGLSRKVKVTVTK